jgi:hypothetical protein
VDKTRVDRGEAACDEEGWRGRKTATQEEYSGVAHSS